jgi:hypothetical protein
MLNETQNLIEYSAVKLHHILLDAFQSPGVGDATHSAAVLQAAS